MNKLFKKKKKEFDLLYSDARKDVKIQFPEFDLKEVPNSSSSKKVFKIIKVEKIINGD